MKNSPAQSGAVAYWHFSYFSCFLSLFNRRSESALFFAQKIIRRNASLLEDRPQGALRHIAGMIGNGGVSISLRVVPDFVTACGLAVEGKAKCFKTSGYIPVTKTCQTPHLCPHHQWAIEGIADDLQDWGVMPLCLGFQKFSGDIAGDFHGLGDRPALGDQTGDIVGSGEINPFRQFLDMDIDKSLHKRSPEPFTGPVLECVFLLEKHLSVF